jgi:hypothetical protein
MVAESEAVGKRIVKPKVVPSNQGSTQAATSRQLQGNAGIRMAYRRIAKEKKTHDFRRKSLFP